MRQLHIIPRLAGGGPELALLARVDRDRRVGRNWRHDIVVLDTPVASSLFLRARRLGARLLIDPAVDAVQRAAEIADIVHLHYWNHPKLTGLLRGIALPPCRIVLWAHILGTRAPQVLFADLGRYADRLVLTSELSRASAAAQSAMQSSRSVDVVRSTGDMARLDGFAPRPHDGLCVGYVGLVSPTKMHPRFVEICLAARAEGLRFVVCGSGGGEAGLRQRAAALGAAGRFDVRGHVDDVAGALAEFDIFGYPLAEDTYATSERALQEAMWVGLPPVVFPHGGIQALIDDGRTGIVARSEGDYPDALDRLARDAALRRRIGDEARRFARANFDPELWAPVVDRILDEVLALPRRTRANLPGAGENAAEGFVRSLGDQAGPFAISLAGAAVHGINAVEAADEKIAAASPLLARGEGGIVHHRNAAPGDPHLRLWSALVSAAAGAAGLAHGEMAAARSLGLPAGHKLPG